MGWNAYDSLNVYFNEAELGIAPIKAEKDYKNSMTYRIGASYKTTDRLVLRAGVYYDQSPIRKKLYNPETPGMDKLGLSAGLTFEPYKGLQFDVAFFTFKGLASMGSTRTRMWSREWMKCLRENINLRRFRHQLVFLTGSNQVLCV